MHLSDDVTDVQQAKSDSQIGALRLLLSVVAR
jgi:hypothetical protein